MKPAECYALLTVEPRHRSLTICRGLFPALVVKRVTENEHILCSFIRIPLLLTPDKD